SLDGTCLDVADTPHNAEAFGRPGSSRRQGGGAFPQLRLVAVSECGTHAITSAVMGPYETSENALADQLLGSLGPGLLCLADRGVPQAQERYRLLSTILECEAAPASELAALYGERWELEGTLDELKTHQRGPRVVLRSKHPDGVYQEAYGYLCSHYAIRRLMHDATLRADLDPDRLSFIRGLRAARRSTRTQPGFSPPDDRRRA